MNGRRVWIWLLATGCVAGAAGAGYVATGGKLPSHAPEVAASTKAVTAEPKPVAVTVAKVTRRDVQRSVQVVGSLYGQEEVALSCKVSGRIARIHHDIGDVVRPGELLLEIDPVDHELAVSEARRSLQLEAAKLGLKDVPTESFDIEKLPAVTRAGIVLKNAANKKDRAGRLVTQAAMSREERDQVDADYDVAKADYQQSLLDARTTVAQLQHRQAALNTALQKLQDTRVLVPVPTVRRATGQSSPFQGEVVPASASGDSSGDPSAQRRAELSTEYVVAARMVSEGEMVMSNSTTPLFRLIIDRPLKLSVSIPERHAGSIKVGQSANLEVESRPGEVVRGQVARVNPTVDRTNRTFQAEIQVPNEDRRLSAGSFARATIQTHRDPGALTVPDDALVTFAGVTKVFVVRDNKSHAVPVKLGVHLSVSGTGWTEVTGNLHAGDQVVATGHSQLAEDSPIRIRQADEQQTATPAPHSTKASH